MHDKRFGTVVLLFVEFDLVIFSQCDQLLHHVVRYVEVLLVLGELRIFLVQFGTMAVQIIHGDAVHQAGGYDATMIVRVAGRVDGIKTSGMIPPPPYTIRFVSNVLYFIESGK